IRKLREVTVRWRGPIDLFQSCDEKVARGEQGRRRHRWSDSHVFFYVRVGPRRKGSELRDTPRTIDRKDDSELETAHEQMVRVSGHAYWLEDTGDKGTWIGHTIGRFYGLGDSGTL